MRQARGSERGSLALMHAIACSSECDKRAKASAARLRMVVRWDHM